MGIFTSCMPVHDGPFFFAEGDVHRCDACGRSVTCEQIRLAARHMAIAGDGNDLQRWQSAERLGRKLGGVAR